MSDGCEEFWSTLPEKVLHPVRVPIVEALRWTGEPLSAIQLVDVLDGFASMWEIAHHLGALEALDLAEPVPVSAASLESRFGVFDIPYRLTDSAVEGGAGGA